MPARTTRTHARDSVFFLALQNGHSVRSACLASGYTRQVVYRWRLSDPDFDEAWQQALMMAADLLEEEADRRARDGTDQPVFFRGGEVGAKRKFSDALLLARLKAIKPHLYRERTARPVDEQRPITVVVRDYDLEDQVRNLVREGRVSAEELSPQLRARILGPDDP